MEPPRLIVPVAPLKGEPHIMAKTKAKSAGSKTKPDKRKNSVANSKLEQKKRQKKMLKDLEGSAKVINVRMEKFYKGAEKANDHREAAAIEAAKVKEKIESVGLKFKTWCGTNLTQLGMGYENMRKLAIAGASSDVQLAIADMRVANKEANQKLREKDKANKDAAAKAAKKKAKAKAKKQSKPEAIINEIVALYEKLDVDDRDKVFQIMAKDLGYAIGDPEDDEDDDDDEATYTDDDDEAKPDDDEDDDDDDDDDEDTPIPESLRRKKQ